jgi:hypothetical protein
MKKKSGGDKSNTIMPFSEFGFECGGTTPAEDAKLCLQKRAQEQNNLNQAGGNNLNCIEDTLDELVIPQFFITNPAGPVDSNLLSKSGNETNVKGKAQSEFDHYAFSGGKKTLRKKGGKRKKTLRKKGGNRKKTLRKKRGNTKNKLN